MTNFSISVTILLWCFAFVVSGAPLDFEDYLIQEFAKRNSRSPEKAPDIINPLEWHQPPQPEHNEIREDFSPNEIDFKNEYRKKLLPIEALMMRRRLENSNIAKDRGVKRNAAPSANYYMQLCHFKICNMGKRRTRFIQ